MHRSQNPRKATSMVIAVLALTGCTQTARIDRFRSSFLPTPPSPSTETVEVAEPPVIPSLFPKEAPAAIQIQPKVSPRPQLDERIRRAEERFLAGRRLYQQGDFLAARVQFDLAVDTLLSSPESAPDRHLMEKKLEELVDRIHRYDVEGLGAGDDQQVASYEKSPLQEILEMTFPVDPSIKTKVKGQVQATASQLPLEENDEVLRYINYFSSERGRKTLVEGLKRAGRYRPMISRILAEEGVPQELIFLAQAESAFQARAYSYKAAAGMWQFVQWRGNEYGLKQTAYIDERLDPEKATRAGARHLKDLFKQFGDWYLAMAAYNCGPNCVARAVERTGFADFWELRNRKVLPQETANYVPLILAMTIMAKNARDYGIEDVTPDAPVELDTVEMTANTSLPLLADLLDVSVNRLRELNPSLMGTIAPATYNLRIPKDSANTLMAALLMIPADKRASWRTHRVLDGETVESIARRYGTAVANIGPINRPSLDDIRAGDVVLVQAAAPPPKVIRRAPVRQAVVRGRVVRGSAVAIRRPSAARQAPPVRGRAVAATTRRPPQKATAYTSRRGRAVAAR